MSRSSGGIDAYVVRGVCRPAGDIDSGCVGGRPAPVDLGDSYRISTNKISTDTGTETDSTFSRLPSRQRSKAVGVSGTVLPHKTDNGGCCPRHAWCKKHRRKDESNR